MKTETGYAADLQAIADQIDRRDREIVRKCEVIEKLSDKVQDRDDTIESLQKQLIERLAEINEKDNRIAVLDHLLKEVSDNLDASERDLREAQETVKRLQQSGVGA